MISSLRRSLWPIIPQITGVSLSTADPLPPPEFAAVNQVSSFRLSFVAVSLGATKVHVSCSGMNFAKCRALYNGKDVYCTGGLNSGTVDVTILAYYSGETPTYAPIGNSIPDGPEPAVFVVYEVTNPASTGPTSWDVVTYSVDTNGNDFVVDMATGQPGYPVLGFIEMDDRVDCGPPMLLNPAIPDADKMRDCTARLPWYLQRNSVFTLNFTASSLNSQSLDGLRMLIQPPSGYFFTPLEFVSSLGEGQVIEAVTGISNPAGALNYYAESVDALMSNGLLSYSASSSHLSKMVLLATLPANSSFATAISLRVRVEVPGERPATNRWRVLILNAAGFPTYSNNDALRGVTLFGTFQKPGYFPEGLTSLKWLLSDFPSEKNMIRLRLRFLSPLVGKRLQVVLLAPSGFVLDDNCLPEYSDILPTPVITSEGSFVVSSAWVESCSSDFSNPRQALLSVSPLEKDVEYAVNLGMTNPRIGVASQQWELKTFSDGNFEYVHFGVLLSFNLRTMSGSIYPENTRYAADSMLHIRFNALRDLGAYGQIELTAPSDFELYCALAQFFYTGNLPEAVECSAANYIAIISLTGDDSLERGVEYYFALRVTNPSVSEYTPTLFGTPQMWRIRLQTQSQELVHETSEIAGYAPTDRGLDKFTVSVQGVMPKQEAKILVRFQLETDLRSWQVNSLELIAPSGFNFTCGTAAGNNNTVAPHDALQRTDADPYIDIAQNLERPPGKDSSAYVDDGTAGDGRSIVDCTVNGIMTLAVSYTDDVSERRYALATTVINGAQVPIPNLWRIRIYTGGKLVEEGAAAGYELAAYASTGDDGDDDTPNEVVSSGSYTLRMNTGRLLGLLRLALSALSSVFLVSAC